MMGYLYIAGCIALTVYGQPIIKWRMSSKGELPKNTAEKLIFLLQTLFGDIFMRSGFVAAFVGSLFWMAAMTKFEFSFAYPVMSLAFAVSVLLFGETMSLGKFVGLLLLVAGIFATAKL